MREAMTDVWQIGATVREARNTGCHPRNPDACVRYGRTCAFFDVCAGDADIETDARFVRTAVHPELDAPATRAA